MNAYPSYQNRWRWFARCLVLGVAATCFATPASEAEPAEMPFDHHGDGLRAEGLIAGKLRSIVIPEIRLVDATVEEAIDFLRTRVFELDPDPNPQTRGVNMVVEPLAANEAVPRITLHVRDVPAGDALRYITDLTALTYRIDDFAVIVTLLHNGGPPVLVTRRYRVPPDFIKLALPDDAAVPIQDPFFSPDPDAPPRPPTAKDVLAAQGVTFGEGARVFFDRDRSSLIVRNTRAQHDLIEAIWGGCVVETSDTCGCPDTCGCQVPPERLQDEQLEDDAVARADRLIAEKLRSIVIPQIRLDDVSAEEALEFLRTRVFELDPDPDPNTRGVNIVMQPGAADEAPRINLEVRGIPAGEALRYITDLAGLTYQIDAFAVIVVPPGLRPTLYTRRFQVTPDSMWIVRREVEVTFGEGASAFFDSKTSTLVVRNTLAELEWIDAILGGCDEEPIVE